MPFYLGGFLFPFDALTSWDLADPGGTVAARAESESESESESEVVSDSWQPHGTVAHQAPQSMEFSRKEY